MNRDERIERPRGLGERAVAERHVPFCASLTQDSPKPPSGRCTESSHSTALRIRGCPAGSRTAAKPVKAAHVP